MTLKASTKLFPNSEVERLRPRRAHRRSKNLDPEEIRSMLQAESDILGELMEQNKNHHRKRPSLMLRSASTSDLITSSSRKQRKRMKRRRKRSWTTKRSMSLDQGIFAQDMNEKRSLQENLVRNKEMRLYFS